MFSTKTKHWRVSTHAAFNIEGRVIPRLVREGSIALHCSFKTSRRCPMLMGESSLSPVFVEFEAWNRQGGTRQDWASEESSLFGNGNIFWHNLQLVYNLFVWGKIDFHDKSIEFSSSACSLGDFQSLLSFSLLLPWLQLLVTCRCQNYSQTCAKLRTFRWVIMHS